MSRITVKVTLPDNKGALTLSIDPAVILREVKQQVSESVREKNIALFEADNYVLETPTGLVLSDETISLRDAATKAGLVAGQDFELKLQAIDPLQTVWKEKILSGGRAEIDRNAQVQVKVHLPTGSQTVSLTGESPLSLLKEKVWEKLEKRGGVKNLQNMSEYAFQLTESGLLLPNENLCLADVVVLEGKQQEMFLTMSLKLKSEFNEALIDANRLAANYKAGLLNYHKGKSPAKAKRPRWFILEEFILKYYRNPDDPAPKRELVIAADMPVIVDDLHSSAKQFFIQLMFPGEPVWLGCDTNEERTQWLSCFNTARLSQFKFVLEKSVTFLNENALKTPGLFRVSAREGDILKLKKSFDDASAMSLESEDPHVVAGVLKRYFRGLPEPLLTYDLYDRFINTQSIADEDEKAHAIIIVLSLLPPINRLLLQYLIAFLARVCSMSEVNEMSPANLATVFAPSLLLRKGETPEEALGDTSSRLHLIKLLISEYDYFFSEDHLATETLDLEQNLDSSEDEEDIPTDTSELTANNRNSLPGITPRPEPLPQAPTPAAAAATDSKRPANPNGLTLARAIYDHEAKEPRALSFSKGDWIFVLKRNAVGWWLGETNGRKGIFPYNYVEIVEDGSGDPKAPAARKTSIGGQSVAASMAPANPLASAIMPPAAAFSASAGQGAIGGIGAAAGSTADVLRQRYEEEAHARRHAEESRKALSQMLDESRRAAAAEQRARTELSQRTQVIQQQLQLVSSQYEAAEREKATALSAQRGLDSAYKQLEAQHAAKARLSDQLLQERGRLEIASRSVQEVIGNSEPAKNAIAEALGATAAVSQGASDAESLSLEAGRRTQLLFECASHKSSIDTFLAVATRQLNAAGKEGAATELMSRHTQRQARQLNLARSVTAALEQLENALKEEVDDIKASLNMS